MEMDSEMRKRARAAVRGVLEAADFEVEELEGPLDLYASKGDECLIVQCSDDPEEILEFDRRNYRLRGDQGDFSCRKLLFTLSGGVQVRNCITWGISEFSEIAGRAVVAEVTGERLDLNLEASSRAGVPYAGPEATGPVARHLPPKIDQKRAVAVAGIEGTPIFRYIPYWEYSASCAGRREYKGKSIDFSCERRGFINAINGRSEMLNTDGAQSSALREGAELMPPKISKEEAMDRIKGAIIEEQTQKVRFRQEKGDAIFYEEKIFRPEPGEVKVELELLHVPVWTVRGKKIVEVNGITGEILEEPMDEGVEVY
ncbi:MAG: hypothetical protein QHG99_07120 [Methanomicrobiales archaeon]|nr:hypothetical protein [Methanomicrobiales archaeon]